MAFFFVTASKKNLGISCVLIEKGASYVTNFVKVMIKLVIKQIGLPLRGRPILIITRMITDRIGFHSVLLPLLISQPQNNKTCNTL